MTAFPSYATGTVSVNAGDTAIVGVGTIWSGVNVRAGDDIVIAGHTVIVQDVTDTTHIAIGAWPYSNVTAGSAYKVVQRSPLRFAGGQAMADVSALVAALNTDGFYVFVGSTLSVPDPSYGNDGQYAFQPSTGKLWVKTSGVWTFIGIYKGFGTPAAYDNAHTYGLMDVATSGGSSYVYINATPSSGNAPPNATYWVVLASKGDTGTTGPTGASYGGTSTTSLVIAVASKVFTTQAGLAYTNGARVRASSAANTSNWMEGLATYSGTALTINVDKTNGSGTLADWNFNLVGQPGAGDLSSANNLSDLASAATAATNLGVVRYAAAQSLTAAQKAQARANIDVLKNSYIINGAMMVSQENGAAAGTTSGYYPVDTFTVAFSNGGSISTSQVAVTTPGGSPNRLRVTVTAADAAVGASDYSIVQTKIEGLRCADLNLGTASAKAFTIQFGVKAPAGTYSISLYNNASNRTYTGEYTISAGEANTDTIKSVTLTGDTSGTWATDNTIGLVVNWSLMCGSSLAGAAGSWGAGAVLGSTNQFNFMGTNGNVFELFDVGLYAGAAAPAFQVPDFVSELARCKRYWCKSYDYSVAPGAVNTDGSFLMYVAYGASVSGAGGHDVRFGVSMRAIPTLTTYSPASGASGKIRDSANAADVSPTISAQGTESFYMYANMSAATTALSMNGHWTASARL